MTGAAMALNESPPGVDNDEEAALTPRTAAEVEKKTVSEELTEIRGLISRLAGHTEQTSNIAEEASHQLSRAIAQFSQVDVALQTTLQTLEFIKAAAEQTRALQEALLKSTEKTSADVALLFGKLETIDGRLEKLHEQVFEAIGRAGKAEQAATGAKAVAFAAKAEARVAETVAKSAETGVTLAKADIARVDEKIVQVDNKLDELKDHVVNPGAAAEHERRRSHQEDELRDEVKKHRELERALLLAKEEEDRKTRELERTVAIKAKDHEQQLEVVREAARREERRAIWTTVSRVAAGVFSAGFLAAVVALASRC